MGKTKGKGDEHACRINYLFQASQAVAKTAPNLNQYYGKVLTVITEKTAPKKDFTMKRSMCKRCQAVLVVGVNATYRLRKNKRRKGTPNVIIGCNLCGETKSIPTTRGYNLHAEVHGKLNTGPNNLNNRKGTTSPSTHTQEPSPLEIGGVVAPETEDLKTSEQSASNEGSSNSSCNEEFTAS